MAHVKTGRDHQRDHEMGLLAVVRFAWYGRNDRTKTTSFRSIDADFATL
jgi:hypothetical protein